ncbi:PhnA protein [Brucella pinnipedialis M292/94/1]|uniref:PhnA protein n=1 Tax=Brucella pinnipedialis M292/94/1 TaxID=520462 RepID=A0A0E1X5J4_9HYPH|nr:PhnA protein [Brucella pinnipedialis M292/94/1]
MIGTAFPCLNNRSQYDRRNRPRQQRYPTQYGDSVTLIKDLKVKGTSTTLKRGTLVKGIRLTGNPAEVECSTKQVKGLVLRTEFLKKA